MNPIEHLNKIKAKCESLLILDRSQETHSLRDGMSQAGWRSTIATIDLLLHVPKLMVPDLGKMQVVQTLLCSWPEELLNACAGKADPAAEFAELERQRDEARDCLHSICSHLRRKNKSLPNPAEVQNRLAEYHQQVEAMREAVEAAKGLLHHVSNWHRSRRQDAAAERWEAALAKLEPFITP